MAGLSIGNTKYIVSGGLLAGGGLLSRLYSILFNKATDLIPVKSG